MRWSRGAGVGCLLLAAVLPARALGPQDVFLLVNRKVPASRPLAEHYCRQRSVPTDHIIELDLPTGEDISRADYNRLLAAPVRAALKDRRGPARVLLSIYGVPLRVGGQEPSKQEQAELAKLKPEIDKLQADERRLQEKIKAADAPEKKTPAAEREKLHQELETVRRRLRPLHERQHALSYAESHACVDSELSLLWWDHYELRRWQVNPLYWQVPESFRRQQPSVVMTARLDGPTPALVRRLIDDAVATERQGLAGRVYVDARGIRYDPAHDPGFGYGGYDESLREMARLLEKAKLPVTLDDRPELFKPGSCPDCALYCGWYSLANYVDSCRFVRGAVAYHIASSEAVSLRDPKSKLWCKNLLEHGACATLGPVAEPYTIGFPKPAEFFGFLGTGRYTLVECYWRTALLTSWMTVLVGDPLYNPYAKKPCLEPKQVQPSPKGGKFLLRE